MKKLLSGIVTIVLLVALATSVNASSISANKTEANKGDTVVVTVSVNETHSIGAWLKYDSSKFEFVSASSSIGELTTGNANGVVKVAGTSTDKTTTAVTFTFKAKELTDSASFEVTRLTTESNEAMPANTVSVKVSEKTATDTGKEETTDTDKEDTTNTGKTDKKETTTNKKVNDEGKTITKLPQTGASVVAIAGIALTTVAGIVVARKISK